MAAIVTLAVALAGCNSATTPPAFPRRPLIGYLQFATSTSLNGAHDGFIRGLAAARFGITLPPSVVSQATSVVSGP